MIIRPIKTHIFQEGDDLFTFITRYVKKLPENSVIVIASKIASLAEQRTVPFGSDKEKEELIRKESNLALPTKYVWFTVKDDLVMASAGIDESNANGKWILVPKDSFKVARSLRKRLQKKYGVKNLGVLITDSCPLPLRKGVIGLALGYAGFRGVRDYRGEPDIFVRKFSFSSTDVADSLATAAGLVMGEGDEQQPLAIIQSAPLEFCERTSRKELFVNQEDDMYEPLLSQLPGVSS